MIDPELQAELRARFNPDGSDLRKAQLRMLEMLKYIDRICTENNITYWLSSGTCLGAVRHGGFIPWDDDCDIEMLEPDYRKFDSVMRHIKDSKYVLQTHKNDYSYFPRFGKFRDCNSFVIEHGYDRKHKYNGIFIDVFPLNFSNSRFLHSIGGRILYYVAMFSPKFYKNRTLTTLLRKAGQLTISLTDIILNKLQGIGEREQLRHKSPNYFHKVRFKSEIFPIKRHQFEDTLLPVPNDYDSYLNRLYGDYNRIPDISKNGQQHLQSLKIKL